MPKDKRSRTAATVGFIGLGTMGAPMARNLLSYGMTLTAFDPLPERVTDFVTVGAEGATNVSEVGRSCEIVVLSLPGPPEVQEVVSELLAVLDAGSMIVNTSTISPMQAKELGVAAHRERIAYVDAPITGGKQGAEAATLTIMVGAEQEDFARAIPLLEILGSNVVYTGGVGTGTAAKLLALMLQYVNIVAVSDAVTVARTLGLELDAFTSIVTTSTGGSWVAEHELPLLVHGETEQTFTLGLSCKDLRLIAAVMEDAGTSASLVPDVHARFEDARARFGGDASHLVVSRLSEPAAEYD